MIFLGLFLAPFFSRVFTIENCLRLSSDQLSCEVCFKAFWDDILEICLPPLEPVENAVSYKDDFNAAECADGYGLSSNSKSCTPIPKEYKNCSKGSFDASWVFTCTQCSNGLEIDPATSNCIGQKCLVQNCLSCYSEYDV